MKRVQIYNVTKKTIMLNEAEVADSFRTRLKGLLGRDSLEKDSGLIIMPCNSIHMMGMKFSIDAIFVDKNHKICKIIPNLKKMEFSPVVWKASYVIEAPSGTAKLKDLEINDEIQFK
jgi:uncharacterized membrane protein (UPF0127 family)